ncbi:dienelactone hydrolase family protein [Siccirubricoccus deserti]
MPLLGLFGNDDRAPSPEQVDQHEAELKKHGKNYEFHRYDGAGHGFSTGTGRSTGRSRPWMAGARSSPSSASIWRSREAPACAPPSSRSLPPRAWRSAGRDGFR